MVRTDTRARVLAALDDGSTIAAAGRSAGVTRARASQIARAAGHPPRRPGQVTDTVSTRTARGATLLLRLACDADAAGLSPEDYLRAAAEALQAGRTP